MKRCIYILLLFSKALIGQNIESIATDRPDQTECANIVPVGFFQLENGFSIEKNNYNGLKTREVTYFSSLLKYGISKRIELRLIVENSKIEQKSGAEKFIAKGLNPVQFGFKTNLFHANGLLPETSLIAHIGFPKLASQSKGQAKLSPNFRFTMQHQVTEKATLAYNIGAEWDGDTQQGAAIYTLTTSRSLADKIGAYIEFYGFLSKAFPSQHNFDGGFTMLLKDNILIDISASKGLIASATGNYISLGLSFRLPN
jgi:Putative MetA-pathway of phenol degradation